jgi:uroporphyrinogen-III decarboxylase
LQALGTDPVRFGEYVLEGFYKLTLEYNKIWAQTDIKVFIQHDDIVWTEGPFYNPQWYRQYLFPRYKKLWKPLKDNGIKVLFCSDGTYNEFIDDIADSGADGFIMEPTTDMQLVAEKYGKTHVFVGNADCRILTFGTKDDIKKEVQRCMDIGKKYNGFIMAVGNHIPSNVPIDNVRYYFDSVDKLGKR